MMINDDQERFHILLMGAVDDELDADERKEFARLLAQYPGFVKEFEDYKRLKEATKAMRFKNPPAELWDSYWLNIYNRLERGFGWILLSLGSIILLTFAGVEFFRALVFDSSLPVVVKIGIFCLIGGLAVLLVSVVRERWFVYKSDPYKEIKR
ncbi:MAG TPA: hypothetical protein PLP19_00720 [bacterium]|nr:hypothetical protein [bacterium]HPN41987.1 hypothetical protein [bacterium]